MTTSEPTTGEIAGAIRVCENKLECDVCPMRDKPCGDLYTLAADRLESQERDNETMRGNNFDATSVTNVLAYLDTVMGLIHCADGIKDLIVSMQGTSEDGNVQETSIIAAVKDNGEMLDLAELLGKDGAET